MLCGQDSDIVQEAATFKAQHAMLPEEPQMADWNGGIGSRQLAWLNDELASACQSQERSIVACHHQIGKGTCMSVLCCCSERRSVLNHWAWSYKPHT